MVLDVMRKKAIPLQYFPYVAKADGHKAELHELQTSGGEKLRISLQVADYLLSGWVVCDGL